MNVVIVLTDQLCTARDWIDQDRNLSLVTLGPAWEMATFFDAIDSNPDFCRIT